MSRNVVHCNAPLYIGGCTCAQIHVTKCNALKYALTMHNAQTLKIGGKNV